MGAHGGKSGFVGLDVGYGHVKVVWSEGREEPKTLSFPSIAPVDHRHLRPLASMESDDGTLSVVVAGTSYLVGPDAGAALAAGATGRVQTEAYASTPEYAALTRGALFLTGLDRVETICVGLPVQLFSARLADAQESANGPHQVGGKVIGVGSVIVAPQPMGSLLALAKENRQQFGTVLIVDVGFGTLDWLVFEMKPGSTGIKSSRSGGLPLGMRELIDIIRTSISQAAGVQYTRVDKIEEALAGNGRVMVNGSPVRVEEHMGAAKQQLNQSLSEIKRTVGNGSDIEHILLTGGGALLYRELIAEQFPKIPATVLRDPAFANARGFHLKALGSKKP